MKGFIEISWKNAEGFEHVALSEITSFWINGESRVYVATKTHPSGTEVKQSYEEIKQRVKHAQ